MLNLKLYRYYLRKMFDWTFWLLIGISVLTNLLAFFYRFSPEAKTMFLESDSLQKLEAFTKKVSLHGYLTTTLNLYLLIIYFLIPLFDKPIASLLGVGKLTSVFKRRERDKTEDQTVLAFTTPIRRSQVVGSKLLAFVTRFLIVNFLLVTLPFLIVREEWRDLFYVGIFLPLLVCGILSINFYTIDFGNWIIAGLLVGTSLLSVAFQILKLKRPGQRNLDDFDVVIFSPVKFSLFSLLFGSLSTYLYYREFETEDFS